MEKKLYEQLQDIDVLNPIEGEFDRGKVRVKPQTKQIEETGHLSEHVNHGWVHTRMSGDRNCKLWFDVIWDRYRLVPRGCLGCWKIVARPQNLKQTMQLYKVQQKMNLPSKCGMDRRPYSNGLWAGFWYCPRKGGLDEARKLWKRVKKEVKAACGPSVSVILKRG